MIPIPRYGFLVLAWALLVSAVPVQAGAKSPDEVIRDALEQMTSRIDEERQKLENDEEYARQVVEEELDGLVDFRRVTRAVMADHFRAASSEQRNRFMETFRDSLLDTYAAGITLYEGQHWEVKPLGEGDIRGQRARVSMEFRTDEGRRVPVLYSMINNDGQWQVENLIVNNLNLGQVFRAQFGQAMREQDGDLDRVIRNWSGELDEDETLQVEGED